MTHYYYDYLPPPFRHNLTVPAYVTDDDRAARRSVLRRPIENKREETLQAWDVISKAAYLNVSSMKKRLAPISRLQPDIFYSHRGHKASEQCLVRGNAAHCSLNAVWASYTILSHFAHIHASDVKSVVSHSLTSLFPPDVKSDKCDVFK